MRDRHHEDTRTSEGIEAFINGPSVRRVRRVEDDPRRRSGLAALEDPGAWQRALELEDDRVARYRRPAAVVGLDVSLVGADPSFVAEAVGEAMTREARETDRITWVGAGRFHVLLPETSEREAIRFAERARIAARAVAAWTAGPRADADVRVETSGAIAGRSLAVALEVVELALAESLEAGPDQDANAEAESA